MIFTFISSFRGSEYVFCQVKRFWLQRYYPPVKIKLGGVVSTSDFQSGGSGFESRAGHLLDLFSVALNPTGRLLSSGVLNPVLLHLNYKFVSSI